jgi:CubicO group peptidase (beta-lactamase class C family)
MLAKRHSTCLGTLLAVTAMPSAGLAATPLQPPIDAASVTRWANETFPQALARHHFSGATVSVVANGAIIFSKGYGRADFSHPEPVDPERTQFRIGSITKMFTASMILQLVEEGKLKLTDTLDKFLPQVPNAKKITIVQILWHRSGIPNVRREQNSQGNANTLPMTKGEMLALIVKATPEFEPDTKYSYSNSGYQLLGLILEKVIGKSYEEALKERRRCSTGSSCQRRV